MSDSSEQKNAEDSSNRDASPPVAAPPHMVQCVKFETLKEGLAKPPLKGELGQKIYNQVSKEAWQAWLEHSKMLINEYRLDLISESGQRVWMTELNKYFWGEGSSLPSEYRPEEKK